MKHFFFLLFGLFLIIPFAAFGAFERDLYFGMSAHAGVTELQRFLTEQKVYEGPITGNFFTLTREGVKRFQEREKIMPIAGYFGPLTRARANQLLTPSPSRGSEIKELQAQIALVQAEIAERLALRATPPPPPPPEPILPPPPPPPPPPPAVLEVKGTSEALFPDSEITPLKLGDISIRNGTNSAATFAQIELDIYDAMNSTLNRSNLVRLVLRQGPLYSDTLISKTKFTFNTDAPPLGSHHRRQIKLSFPITFQPGEEKTIGFWVEDLKYVISGSLRIELYQFHVIDGVPTGTFKFVLTKQQI